MGRIFEPQAIINTREAKGIKTSPASRGVKVNCSEIKAKRESRLQTPHPTPNGREANAANFSRLKLEASSITGVAHAPELLQIDPPIDGEAASLGSPRL